jgi:hypothetical protein
MASSDRPSPCGAASPRPRSRRPSNSRGVRRIAVVHAATGRAQAIGVAPEIGLARQVVGVVAGVSLAKRRVPRRRIVALRDRARNKRGGQSRSQKKFFHNRLRDVPPHRNVKGRSSCRAPHVRFRSRGFKAT